VTPGRPLPPNLPGRPFNPHGSAYDFDGAHLDAVVQNLIPDPPAIVGTLKEPAYDPATGEIGPKDTGIPVAKAADGSLQPVARTPEDVQKLGEVLDAYHAKNPAPSAPWAAPSRQELDHLIWKADLREVEIQAGKDPFYETRRLAREMSQPQWGRLTPAAIRGHCQEYANRLNLEFCWCPLQSAEEARIRQLNQDGTPIEQWVYLVRRPGTSHTVYGPSRDLIGLARTLLAELNAREDAQARAEQVAEHYRALQAKTKVKQWVGDEPTVADDVEALKTQNAALIARLGRAGL
jgi:hypothetical protein